MAKKPKPVASNLNSHAFGMIGVLIFQYLLGITTNLFVAFPKGARDGQLWVFAWHQLPLALHIIVGLLLLIGTLALLARAILIRSRIWIVSAAIAALSILGAIVAGSIFIPSQTGIYSLVMAIGFIVALLAYFWGLYQSHNASSLSRN